MIFKKFPILRQLDIMDCGPTCLQMVFKYHGKDISLESIRRTSHLNSNGVSILGLSETAEKYGFQTTSAKISLEQLLDDAPLPCILYWEKRHFVVLTPSSSKKKMTIADPAKGIVNLNRKEFLERWCVTDQTEIKKGIVLLLTPTTRFYEFENENIDVGWIFLLKYALKFRSNIFQLFLGLLVGSLLQLALPFLTQSVVDTGINTQNLHFIQIILIAQFTLFFARSIVEFIRGRILLFISTHINLSILSDFWAKLMRLPMNFFDTRRTGDILQRIYDHHRIENFITVTALQAIFSIFTLILFSIVLLLYNVKIFFIFLIGSILYLIWVTASLKYRANLNNKQFAIASKESSATMQLILGMQEIKLNNAEQIKRSEWEGIQASLFKLNFKTLTLNQYQQTGAFFLNEGKNIIITYLVAVAVLNGQLTLGAMLAIQYIIGQLNSPIEHLILFTQQAQDAKISLMRLNEVHQLDDEEPSDEQFISSLNGKLDIEFENISFTYIGAGNDPVLKGINLKIPVGKTTAIVGVSGSGKTTLLKLLLKFYDNYQGDIKVGSHSLKKISPKFWRSQCGSVLQDGFIFSDSIVNNISVSDQVVDSNKLIHACRVANILDFIEALPLGFNTKIGAEGAGISAGQKQRILIARAVYKNPSYIFFDEATNALDSNNEKTILEYLNDFCNGKTVVVCAHRLSTVKNADKIIVLDAGVVVEEGTHIELSEKKGKYYELVKNQLELVD